MLVKLNWINQFVNLKDKTYDEIIHALNSLGLEVEWHKPICSGTNLVSAKVVTKEKHPKADKLNLCQVDLGNEVVQIVCGADNFKSGDTVIVAKPGAMLPNGVKIKTSEIRGQKSNGMICSLKELGYPSEFLSEDNNKGIYVVKKDIAIGQENVLSLLELDDLWLEVAITFNRGDWNGIYEIAKELAIYFKKDLKELAKTKVKYIQNDNLIKQNSANGFALLNLSDLQIQELPIEMKTNLQFLAIQLVSPLVDIGNIVAKELGQPIHLYDARKVKGHIRSTKGLEGTILALDDNKYTYTKNDIVIIDDSGVIGIAGVIGGKSTMVDHKTNDIIVEVGNFDNLTIRKTAQRLNLLTDSATRFSKKISRATIKPTIERIAFMFNKYFGAKIGKCLISKYDDPLVNKIDFDISMIKDVLGFEIDQKIVKEILARLDFKMHDKKIVVPAYRVDLTLAQDVIEEIARIYGYDNLASHFEPFIPTPIDNVKEFDFQNLVRKSLVSQGQCEVITYSLSNQDKVNDFALYNWDFATLSNPISQDRTTLRLSAVNSLIEVAKNNIDRGNKEISIFEISQINTLTAKFGELTVLHYGNIVSDFLYQDVKKASFFTLKTTLTKLMADLGIIFTRFQFKTMQENNYFNHHNAANIYFGKEMIGRLGQVHPAIAQKYKLKDLFIIQLDLDKVMMQKVSTVKAKELTQFPSVVEDYTVDVPTELAVNDLIMMARKSSKLIKDIKITSIYTGQNIDHLLKAVTLKIEYNNPKATITQDQINDFRNSFIELCQNAKYTIRG